jgi:hypothetical protein
MGKNHNRVACIDAPKMVQAPFGATGKAGALGHADSRLYGDAEGTDQRPLRPDCCGGVRRKQG